MASRTTLVLDDKAREAARELARRYGCSLSEATRRALIRQRDLEVGIPRERRRERVEALCQENGALSVQVARDAAERLARPFMEVTCQDVKFDGEAHISKIRSSEWAERGFCAKCGSNLFYHIIDSTDYQIAAD